MKKLVAEFAWPQWLENFLIADALREQAYNNTPAAYKAAIKTAIALGFFYFGQAPARERLSAMDTRAGVKKEISHMPADWAFLIFPHGCGAATMTAGAILPVLANVPHVAACQIGPLDDDFLITMELCGIEDIYSLHDQALEICMQQLLTQLPDSGKIFIELCPSQQPLQFPGHTNILIHEINNEKAFMMPAAYPEKALIEFCLGKLIPFTSAPEEAEIIYTGENDYSGTPQVFKPDCLILAKGCEGFYRFPGLTPGCFHLQQINLSLL